jgi:hypothetical protein
MEGLDMPRNNIQNTSTRKLPLRNHFRRDGKPKHGFTTIGEAREFSRGYHNIYQCDFCGKYHLASKDW